MDNTYDPSALLDRQQREVKIAPCPLRRRRHDPGDGRVAAFEAREAELRLCVGMLQRIDQLRGRGLIPRLQELGKASLLRFIIGSLGPPTSLTAYEVVRERQAEAVSDGQDLMHAIGVEGSERRLRRISRMEVETNHTAFMSHDELTAREGRREHHHKRREHSRRFLRIAMLDEETAAIVDEELAELGFDRLTDAEALGHAGEDRLHDPIPAPTFQTYAIRTDLPAAPHRRIEDRPLAAPERSRLGKRDKPASATAATRSDQAP